MKIIKRSMEHYSLSIFVLSAMAFVQVIFYLSHNLSFFELRSWKITPYAHYLIFLIALILLWSLYTVRNYSDKILLLFVILVTLQSFFLLTISFSKIILIYNFLYLIFAFYFFVTWEIEKGKACYNPNFSKNDIEKNTRFQTKGFIQFSGETKFFPVAITNLNDNSCYLLLESSDSYIEALSLLKSTSSSVKLKAVFSGVEFVAEGEVVTSYDRGLGIVYKEDIKERLNWSELYKVCLERGIV